MEIKTEKKLKISRNNYFSKRKNDDDSNKND
jgi:hypothetical protein